MFRNNKSLEKIAEALEEFVELQKDALKQIRLMLPRVPQIPTEVSLPLRKALPDGEREKLIDNVLGILDEEIRKTGPKLLRAAMKEAMLDSGKTKEEIEEIGKKLERQGKKRLKRKKGCLFIEIGDGIDEPIEEIYIRV